MKKAFIVVSLLSCLLHANDNQHSMPNQANNVGNLQPIVYKDKQNGPQHYGLDLNSTVAVYPNLVLTDPNGNPIVVNYLALIPILVQQIQQLQAQVNQLLNQNSQ